MKARSGGGKTFRLRTSVATTQKKMWTSFLLLFSSLEKARDRWIHFLFFFLSLLFIHSYECPPLPPLLVLWPPLITINPSLILNQITMSLVKCLHYQTCIPLPRTKCAASRTKTHCASSARYYRIASTTRS